MKKLALFILVFLIVFVLVHSNMATATEKESIKIGAVYSMSGPISWVGESFKKACMLKVEMINKAGGVDGRPIDVIIYDDQSLPEESAKAAQRLISKDGVVALMSGGTSPCAAVMSSVANKYKVPYLQSSGYDLNPEKEPYTFGMSHPTIYAVSRGFLYFKKEGRTRIALCMPIGSLGEIGIENAAKAAKQYGLTIVGTERFVPTAPDVTPQLAKLRTLEPQAIFSFASGEPAALVAKNMAQLNFNVPLLVSHGNATSGFLKLVSGLRIHILVPSGKIMAPDALRDADPSKSVIVEFNKAHLKRYGETAGYYGAMAADAIGLIAEAIRASGSTNSQKIRDAIEGVRNFAATGGVFNMSPTDHYGTKFEDMIVLTPKGGGWQMLE